MILMHFYIQVLDVVDVQLHQGDGLAAVDGGGRHEDGLAGDISLIFGHFSTSWSTGGGGAVVGPHFGGASEEQISGLFYQIF